MSQSALSSAYGQRIALIRKHFPPGVAAVYATRSWARMACSNGGRRSGNGDVLCSLERRRSAGAAACYDAHLATLDGLIEAMRARTGRTGRTDRGCARRRRWTDCTASTGDCWCACNRILSPTHHRGGAQRAAGALVARGAGRPAPSGGDACRAVVVVQASRGAAVRCGRCSRARARARTGACACAGARIKTRTQARAKARAQTRFRVAYGARLCPGNVGSHEFAAEQEAVCLARLSGAVRSSGSSAGCQGYRYATIHVSCW